MADIVTPPTPGGSSTTISSSDVLITDNMNMNPAMFTPYDICFVTNMYKQYTHPSLSYVPTLQVVQDVTNIDTNSSYVCNGSICTWNQIEEY